MLVTRLAHCLALVLLAAAGCKLDSDAKTACNVPADCVDGYACVGNVCVEPGGPDAPNGTEYGTVMPITSASAGLATYADYKALIGLTAAAGGQGCALLRDQSASPGTATSLALARIPRGESGDTRCPEGNHAIRNDAERCLTAFAELGDNCAVYRAWDTGGKQIANRLAVGGYIAIQDTRISDMQHTCNIELSFAFAGGVTIAKTFAFSYNPFAPDGAFCTH